MSSNSPLLLLQAHRLSSMFAVMRQSEVTIKYFKTIAVCCWLYRVVLLALYWLSTQKSLAMSGHSCFSSIIFLVLIKVLKKTLFYSLVIYWSIFNSSDYSKEHTVKGQFKNNELEMLPNNVVMAQFEVLSCHHTPAVTVEEHKPSVQITGLGAEI